MFFWSLFTHDHVINQTVTIDVSASFDSDQSWQCTVGKGIYFKASEHIERIYH